MKAITAVGEASSTTATGKDKGVTQKPNSEYSPKDIEEVHKDKKTMNILFNGLEKYLFDNAINHTAAKEVWDTIQTLCEGIKQVRENKM